MNIATNLERTAFYFPQRTALIDDGRRVTFRQLDRDAGRVAAALAAAGVRPGDRVALCAPNSCDWVTFYFGALKAGAVAVTFSHLLSRPELAQVLSDCRPRAVFTTVEVQQRFPDHGEGASCRKIFARGEGSLAEFAAKGDPRFRAVERDRHDTCAILYTGGTTGQPRGVLLSHENVQTSIFNVAHFERSTERDRALCFLPLNHVFAQIHIMHSMMFVGAGLVLQPAFDLEGVVDALQRYAVTKFYAVPTVYIRLLSLPGIKDRLRSVSYCFSAAASMAVEVVREWKARTGLAIHEAYGMTESAAMVTYNHYYRHVIGSVGTPANLVEVQIQDEEGHALAHGEEGEICIRGPNITKGYLNNPEETRRAFRGAWLRSGDIGFIDEDGYLFIVDRLKDMIITGGENVYPREVEEALYTLDGVQECAVVGLPDREYGERVTAFIVPSVSPRPDPDALRSALKRRLAAFKVPREFVFVDELPKSSAGKLLKREIRRRYAGRRIPRSTAG